MALALAGMGAGLLIGFGAFVLHVAHPAPPPAGPASPGIAVLTGGPDRLERGLALLAATPGARLLVSGVGRDVTLPDLLAAYPRDASADADRITLGRTATSTRGNAREVAAWVREEGLAAVTVVTAGYHMPRALLELRRALPGTAIRPEPVPPHRARATPLLREYAKLLGAALGLSVLSDRPRRPVPEPSPMAPAVACGQVGGCRDGGLGATPEESPPSL